MKPLKQFFAKNNFNEEIEELKIILTNACFKILNKDNKKFSADLYFFQIISNHDIEGNKNKICIVNSEIYIDSNGEKNIKKFIIEVVGDEYLRAYPNDPNLENIKHTVKVFKITELYTNDQIISNEKQVEIIDGFNLKNCIDKYHSLSYENPSYKYAEEMFHNIVDIETQSDSDLIGNS